MDRLFTAWKSYFMVIVTERIHQRDFDACARLMSNYLIISILHLGSHYLFSTRSQQDKGTGKISNEALQPFSSTLYFCIITLPPFLAMKFRNITIHFVKAD